MAGTPNSGDTSPLGGILRRLLFLFILLVVSPHGWAESTGEPLYFGMSAALSGPAADLGTEMARGIETAFAEQNRRGGVRDRSLRLVALDDGYEPERAVPNMHTLINRADILAIIGNVGTPTAVATVPIANRARIPFFGAFTGAGVLRRTPPDRYIVNFRASYEEETGAMVDGLVNVVGVAPEEIAFFTQRDAYGDAGFTGGLKALKRLGVAGAKDVAHGRYERNTLAVENALADLLYHPVRPRAVIMVGSYAPCAEFIKLAKASGLDALFLNVSFTGTEALRTALGEAGQGVVITQVVPHYDADLPLVKAYRSSLAALQPDSAPSFGSLEGYIVARILILALEKVPAEFTRESVLLGLESLGDFDLGLGAPLHLGPEAHQASHTVWPTIISDGGIVPLTWQDLTPPAGGRS